MRLTNIFACFIACIFQSFQLVEIIGSGLEGQEYVTVLSWVIQTYPGKDLMADLSLGIPQSKVKPLLDAETVIRLQAST